MSARCQRGGELNYDVVRQETTHTDYFIDKKTREDLIAMVGGTHGILSAVPSLAGRGGESWQGISPMWRDAALQFLAFAGCDLALWMLILVAAR